jgi:pimeloyl-ACP methyl ester carboxylesterase
LQTVFQTLHGEVSGEGSGVILLSHGFGSDKSVGSALRPRLEARFTVVAFNLAGCGESGESSYDPDRRSSLFGYADDLLELIHDLGIERCTYIGHSMSGMIGAAAATVMPELFERIIMIGSSPRLSCPTHIVQADRDMAVPTDVGQWLHRHIAGSTLDTIHAHGHLPHLTAPADVLQILEHRLLH